MTVAGAPNRGRDHMVRQEAKVLREDQVGFLITASHEKYQDPRRTA